MASQLEKSCCVICGKEDFKILIRDNESNLVECRHCHLVYHNPRKSKEDQKELYRESYYSPLNKEFWYKTRIGFFKQAIKKIEKIKSKGRLLDLGCGFGYFLDLARKNGWEVYGVEISDYAVQFSEQKLKLNIFHGELRDAHFADSYFDVVTMWNVLELLDEPLRLLQEVSRILKEGGLVVVRMPNMYFQLPAFKFFRKIVIARALGINNPFVVHNYGFSKDTLELILKAAGFKDIQIVNSRLRKRPVAWINNLFFYLAQSVFYLSNGKILIAPTLQAYAFK